MEEDLTGLRSALGKERDRADAAERQLKLLQESNAALQSQIETQKTEFETERTNLLGQISQRDLKSSFQSAFGEAKGRSQYADMVYKNLADQMSMTDGKVMMSDGRSLSDAIGSLRESMPEMFAPVVDAAGSGALPSSGITPASPQVVKSSNGVISGVSPEDVISGKVSIE